jgi:hypothetical protein
VSLSGQVGFQGPRREPEQTGIFKRIATYRLPKLGQQAEQIAEPSQFNLSKPLTNIRETN